MALLRRRLWLNTVVKAFSLRSQSNKPHQTWSPSTSLTIYQQKSIEYLKTNQKKSVDYLKNKVTHAYSWYEEFSGIRELKEAQNRVLLATTVLKEAQERRRESKSPLIGVQKRLQDFQPELRNTPRDDDRYIQLIKEEHSLMKEIKVLQQQLQEAENDEREAFEQLSTSLRTSHEAERVQAEKTKYFSIIASILGTIIGVFGSSINNSYRMKELKALIKESSGSSQIESIMENLKEATEKLAVVDNISHLQDKLNQAVLESKILEGNLQQICKNFENILKVTNIERQLDKTDVILPDEKLGSKELNLNATSDIALGSEYPIDPHREIGNTKLLLPIGALMVLIICFAELLH